MHRSTAYNTLFSLYSKASFSVVTFQTWTAAYLVDIIEKRLFCLAQFKTLQLSR